MKIMTQYIYEKIWRPTSEKDAKRIIEEEVGDVGAEGTWSYVKSVIELGRIITVGECRFRSDKGR
jgi:hypothetical protein